MYSDVQCTGLFRDALYPRDWGPLLGEKRVSKTCRSADDVSKRSMTWRILYLKMVIFIRKLMINHKNSQTTPTSQGTFPISKSCTRSPDASCSALRVELQNRNRNVVRRKHCASKDRHRFGHVQSLWKTVLPNRHTILFYIDTIDAESIEMI